MRRKWDSPFVSNILDVLVGVYEAHAEFLRKNPADAGLANPPETDEDDVHSASLCL
jgi:hypothetical protein